MPYERLIKQGLIKAYRASEREIRSLLKIASRDLSAAESMVGIDPDWAYNISYNAMLQSSRALMLRKGYRPRGAGQHATVVQFVEETIGKQYRNQVAFFDQMRRKRNRLVYDTTNLVSKKESEEALSLAHDFVTMLESLINRGHI
jgi:uncharacterized protein (UPF0332 family)